MNSNSNYTQFIEHSFRRLNLLIHQQDVLDNIPTTSVSTNKTNEQLTLPIKDNINNDELVSFSSKSRYHQKSMNNNPNGSIEFKEKVEPMSRTHRTYMRPPKNRTTSKKSSSFFFF